MEQTPLTRNYNLIINKQLFTIINLLTIEWSARKLRFILVANAISWINIWRSAVYNHWMWRCTIQLLSMHSVKELI